MLKIEIIFEDGTATLYENVIDYGMSYQVQGFLYITEQVGEVTY